MEATLKMTITGKDLAGWFVTAIESSDCRWFWFVKHAQFKAADKPWYACETAFGAPDWRVTIKHDTETGLEGAHDGVKVIGPDDIERGFALMLAGGFSKRIVNLFDDYDCDDVDCLLQMAVFGKLVFG